MVKRIGWMVLGLLMLGVTGCDKDEGPSMKGELVLSTETYLAESYYLFGYAYEASKMSRYPHSGGVVPDIINEGFRDIDGGRYEPGFTTPDFIHGFALLGAFDSQGEARAFYDSYVEIEEGLTFLPNTDTVRLNQVWLQKTSRGHFAKLLVTHLRVFESEGGITNNEVGLEFTYQNSGSGQFPK